ncbi:MAG: hypothetical protein KGS72_08695 [Cyanobacteria bacterium REEB67]|nr:hypothetical protein [Cyanobacteria bacterium REEB67]
MSIELYSLNKRAAPGRQAIISTLVLLLSAPLYLPLALPVLALPDQARSQTQAPAQKNTAQTYAEAQLAREKERQRKYYDGLARNEVETARYKAEQLRTQAREQPMQRYFPNDNTYLPMAGRTPGYYPPSTVPQREPVYVSPELEYAKMKEDMAREKEERLRKVSEQKQAALQQSLDNMKTQMKTSNVPGATSAKAEGSNLFVRYYGPSTNSKPYDVHQAAARIVPHE